MSTTMSRAKFLRTALCGLAVGALHPGVARAATPARCLSGRYRYVGGAPQREQLLQSIDEVVSEMNFVVRPIARSRISEAVSPNRPLEFDFDGGAVTFRNPALPPLRADLGGTPTRWTNQDGATMTVHATLDGTTLKLQFTGDGANSHYTYRFCEETGRLQVRARVTHDRLPKALTYRLNYRRC